MINARQMDEQQRLNYWSAELQHALSYHYDDREKMDRMERLMAGDRELRPITANDYAACSDGQRKAPHVWNIVNENIESMIDSNIPQPKVTPRRKKDEELATMIEAMLRNDLDRLPFEPINDQQERTVPLQGGGYYYIEWDQSVDGPNSSRGDTVVSILHPKLVVPQPGVYTSIQDMDFIFLQIPQTEGYIWRRYGVDVTMEAEELPDLKSSDPDNAQSVERMVTQNIVYWRNDDNTIGLFSWVGHQVLENLDDYQARRKRVCAKCGADEEPGYMLEEPTLDGTMPDPERARMTERGTCRYCGSTEWEDVPEDEETVLLPISMEQIASLGANVEELIRESDGDGILHYYVEAKVPAYKPNVFPLVLQRNVSTYGKLLGDSDAEKIQDQQNTLNRMELKIVERLVKAGSKITMPRTTHMSIKSDDSDVIYVENAAEKAMIGVETFTGDLQYEMAYMQQVYEESRRLLGITDSFQGRKDPTATSGKAKEFAAAQSAGRMESKRIMKNFAYSEIFEMLFKMKLAYCDEPRATVRRDEKGENIYDNFDRRRFLELDEAGNWRWITDFLFSTDTSATLAGNRQAMWQETTTHLQNGAYGDPTAIETLLLYWTKMEELHYPGAATTKQYLTDRLEQQKQAQQAAMELQRQQAEATQAEMPIRQNGAGTM